MQLRELAGIVRVLPSHCINPFLLILPIVSMQAGTMQLRELTGTVTVGQELPMLRVPAPNAREVK